MTLQIIVKRIKKKERTFGLPRLHSAFIVSGWLDEAAMADEGRNKKLNDFPSSNN